MRLAPLTAVVAAIAAAISCGGGAGGTPTPPGSDPAPSSIDRPPSSTDTPPSSTDTPPGGSSGGCAKCTGSYSCDIEGTQVQVALSLAAGVCTATVSGDVDASGPVGCGDEDAGEDAGVDAGEDAGSITVMLSADSSIQVCVEKGCFICSSGGVTTEVDSGSVTITVPGQTNKDDRSSLSSCCGSLSGAEQSVCNDIVSGSNDSECSATLTGYQESKICK